MKRPLLSIGISLFIGNLLLLVAMTYAQDKPAAVDLENDQCYSCHKELELLPEGFQEGDIHIQMGLSCAGCHGGDPGAEDMEEAMSPAKGFVGVPSKQEIPDFCGKCHSNLEVMRKFNPQMETDQEAQYYTSVHGKRLKMGDTKVAACADCHTAHAIFPASDPRSSVYAVNVPQTCAKCHSDPDYMKPYKLPTDQYDKFAKSIHGEMLLKNRDIGAPSCNDCHGNHGARPPGVESIGQICGQCHVNNMKYFERTRMAAAYKKLGLHECVVCHGHHEVMKPSDNMVGVTDDAVCVRCHTPESRGYRVADSLHTTLVRLVSAIDSANALRQRVQLIGLDDIDIGYLLKDAHQSLIHSRTLVHTFDPEEVNKKASEGMEKANEAIALSIKIIRDYHVRRKWFLLASLFTTLVIIGLFLTLREIEQKQKQDDGS